MQRLSRKLSFRWMPESSDIDIVRNKELLDPRIHEYDGIFLKLENSNHLT
jgi:hypothetical protein